MRWPTWGHVSLATWSHVAHRSHVEHVSRPTRPHEVAHVEHVSLTTWPHEAHRSHVGPREPHHVVPRGTDGPRGAREPAHEAA